MKRDKQPLMEPQIEEEQQTTATWNWTTGANNSDNNGVGFKIGDVTTLGDENIGSFKPNLHGGWYMNNNPPPIEEFLPNLKSRTPQQISACSSIRSDSFLMQPLGSSPLINTNNTININNPFGNIFDTNSHNNFLNPFQGSQMDFSATSHLLKFPETRAVGFGPISLEKEKLIISDPGPSNYLFPNNSKSMKPLEELPPIFVSPTLFDKKEIHSNGCEADKLDLLPISQFTSTWLRDFEKKMPKGEEGESVKGLNYETNMVGDIRMMGYNENKWSNNYSGNKNNDNDNNQKNIMGNSDDDKNVVGRYNKGTKKEGFAKSLIAEKRRRKKLSDKLYMLRSIVPKISKMDKASILGDAIDYLKELVQRINDIQSELESSSLGSSLQPSKSYLNVTPPTSTIPILVKEELGPSNVSSLKNQSAKQCRESQDLHPEQIKAVLLDTLDSQACCE